MNSFSQKFLFNVCLLLYFCITIYANTDSNTCNSNAHLAYMLDKYISIDNYDTIFETCRNTKYNDCCLVSDSNCGIHKCFDQKISQIDRKKDIPVGLSSAFYALKHDSNCIVQEIVKDYIQSKSFDYFTKIENIEQIIETDRLHEEKYLNELKEKNNQIKIIEDREEICKCLIILIILIYLFVVVHYYFVWPQKKESKEDIQKRENAYFYYCHSKPGYGNVG